MSKKHTRSQLKPVLTCALTLTLFITTPAYAYVDPGSGSVIVTTILGLIAAIGYTFRKLFYNIRAKLFGSKNKTDDNSNDG